jgi:hypothetical protein
VGWLLDIARSDHNTDEVAGDEDRMLALAADLAVENGLHLGVRDWVGLETRERAALTVARRTARARELLASGRDLDAAAAVAFMDGGEAHARGMMRAAVSGVSEALAQTRKRVERPPA